MLWYLHLCADQGIVVLNYHDEAEGEMYKGDEKTHGRFTKVMLRTEVKIKAGSNILLAEGPHQQAYKHCFIANSCNFPVFCKTTILEKKADDDT